MAEAQVVQAAQTKEAAAVVAVDRMRAFEVGVASYCKEEEFGYDEFAKAAGQTAETLGPNLAEAMVEASKAHEAAQAAQA